MAKNGRKLSAYKDVNPERNTKAEAIILATSIIPIESYFKAQDYTLHSENGENELSDEFNGPDGQIIKFTLSPEPDVRNVRRVRHDWEFYCPDDEADRHIRNLKFIYKNIDFEID